MADEKTPEKQIEDIYNDTGYFVNAIVDEYDFYKEFIQSVQAGSTEISVNRRHLKKTIDEQWVSAIEEAIGALDTVVRNPSKHIEEVEEVLPIEISHNITSRSLRHLAQHSDYIKTVEGDKITPSKILNVFNEETLQTYENKFVNTLIQRLYVFVNRRYMQLKSGGDVETQTQVDFETEFEFANTRGKINLGIAITESAETVGISISDRIARLNSIVTNYLNSEFVKAMGKTYIHPPIMRTNAITKNKDLRQCLTLWDFIESYDKIGYSISAEEQAEKPDAGYVEDLYSLLSLQYLIFKHDFGMQEGMIIDHDAFKNPVEPRFVSKLKGLYVEDFNVYDSEYKRVVPVSQLSSKRKLSEDEQRMRAAIDVALAADRKMKAGNSAQKKK